MPQVTIGLVAQVLDGFFVIGLGVSIAAVSQAQMMRKAVGDGRPRLRDAVVIFVLSFFVSACGIFAVTSALSGMEVVAFAALILTGFMLAVFTVAVPCFFLWLPFGPNPLSPRPQSK